ncbi:MAG: HAD-IC family P-type ATPase, partial [Candidatus Methanomethylicus sp.]|nr:HAD-IC family P-type ATPase [Candidatus Methanomethylicus sp.]
MNSKMGPLLEEIEDYSLPLDQLENRLQTDAALGLTSAVAKERLLRFGPNSVPKVKSSRFRTYISPFLNWLISIYLIISAALGLLAVFLLPEFRFQVLLWLGVIAVNALISIIQQARAQMKLTALQRLLAPKSKVMREGGLIEIQSEEVVPGDLLIFYEGDQISADARIVVSSNLRMNEATLTGESLEVEKNIDPLPTEKCPIYNRRNMVFLGTFVAGGSGQALVTETGSHTQIGRLSTSLEELNTGDIPLRRKINSLAKVLALGVLIYIAASLAYNLSVLYFDGSLFSQGGLNVILMSRTIAKSLTTGMSIMPINIPLLITLILITGVLAMTRFQVIIRNLNAIESLGRISVLCSDKTGTITKNEMTVKWICSPSTNGIDRLYGVTGVGFQPDGKIVEVKPTSNLTDSINRDEGIEILPQATIDPSSTSEIILVSGMLNNESRISLNPARDFGSSSYAVTGDATDGSLLFLFSKSGLSKEAYESRFQRIWSYSFDSKLKRMTSIYKDTSKDNFVVFSKGASEVLLPLCSSIAGTSIAA